MRFWGLNAVWRPLILALLFAFAGLLWWPIWLAALVSVIDAHARWHEYEEVHSLAYTPRLADVLRGSWCRRGVAEASWPQAREFYREHGYNWFSIFPDGAPLIFSKFRFWEVVFGFRKGRMRGKTPKYILVIRGWLNGRNSA